MYHDDAQFLVVSGDYAYVAAGEDGLRILDCSNPANPYEIGFCPVRTSAADVAVDGDRAYVADAYFGFQIIDVSDPENPFVINRHEMGGWRLPGEHRICLDTSDLRPGVYTYRLEAGKSAASGKFVLAR